MMGITIINIDTGPRRDETYIGDGVYVMRDDIQMWLATMRGDKRVEIALDRDTYASLQQFAETHGFGRPK